MSKVFASLGLMLLMAAAVGAAIGAWADTETVAG